jgi:hypothetical protein
MPQRQQTKLRKAEGDAGRMRYAMGRVRSLTHLLFCCVPVCLLAVPPRRAVPAAPADRCCCCCCCVPAERRRRPWRISTRVRGAVMQSEAVRRCLRMVRQSRAAADCSAFASAVVPLAAMLSFSSVQAWRW